MTTPSKCPGCGTKLSPEMLACPNCPMSFPEDEGGSANAVNPLKETKYYNFVFPIVFFGAIGAIIWYMGTGLLHLGEANKDIETPNFLRTNGSSSAGRTSASGSGSGPGSESGTASESGSAATPGAKAPEAPSDETPMVSITRAEPEESAAREGAASRRAAEAPVTEWKLRGTIYDLTTLKPLGGVALTFTDEATNRTIRTRSDASGRYRAIVPPLDGRGYSVAVDKNGYAPNYLDPGTEGVREKGAAERKSMARDLASTLGAEPATVQSASAEPLVTDFYLAPRL